MDKETREAIEALEGETREALDNLQATLRDRIHAVANGVNNQLAPLARIEQKIEDAIGRIERQNASLFGAEGIESRLRAVETGITVLRTEARVKAGIIAAFVSGVVAIGATIIGAFFKH